MVNKTDQIEYYENLLQDHGPSYKALDWNSVESQRLRFKIFKEIFIYGKKAAKISVLDIGCGLGDFYGFLKAEGLLSRHSINYTGYDITPKLIEAAKKRYPDGRFELKDVLEDRHVPKFDYLVASGVFNIRTTDEGNHLDYVKEMLSRMYDLAAYGVAANFLSEGTLPAGDRGDRNSTRYYYFRPDEIMNFCRYLASRYIVRHDYHPGDFTIYLLK